jgi:hypothetical protein
MAEAAPPVVPAVSTSAVGPLGIKHAPRFWMKLLLHALGRLPADYKLMNATFDRILIDALELDETALLTFVEAELPNYLRFEQWLSEHGKALSASERDALNAHYTGFKMSEAGATARRAELRLADPSVDTGIILNDLDDWSALHRELTATR